MSLAAVVGNLRLLVQTLANAVSHQVAHHAEAVGFHKVLYGGPNMAHRIPNAYHLDGLAQGLAGHIQQLLQLWLDLTNRNRDCRVGVIAIQHHPAVNRDLVSRLQNAIF